MLHIKVSNVLEVYNLPPALEPYFKAASEFEIPIHSDTVPQYLNLFEKYSDHICIPRGFLTTLEKYCKKNNLPYKVTYITAPPSECDFKINANINYKTGPYGYQQQVVNKLLQYNLTRLESPTGCHAAGTKILLHDGGIKLVEDVTTGDRLMGPDGSPRVVIKLLSGIEPLYKISPKDHESFVVNQNHILHLINTDCSNNPLSESINLPVKNYLCTSRQFKKLYKICKAVNEDNSYVKLPVSFLLQPAGIGEFYGFELDKDHLYLTADNFIHHNSGKTVIACLLIGLLNKGPTLFLADQDRLIRQFINTVEKVLNIPKEDIGIIKAKKHSIKPITVGSLRTLGKEGFNLEALKNTFHTVFFDECHISSALTYRRVILGLAPNRLYGLSATPEHYSSIELNRLMTALLGNIDVKIDKTQLPGRIDPEIIKRDTKLLFHYSVHEGSPAWYKHKSLNRLFRDISEHEGRNQLIVRDCIKLVNLGCKVLITTKRVAHAALLHEKLASSNLRVSFPYTYKLTKAGEEQAKVNHKQLDADVEEIERGNIDVLIGTYTLFQKGFDCTPLSALMLAAPFSGINSTLTQQTVGRIQRHYFGKDRAVVIDYADRSEPNNLLDFWANERYNTMVRLFEQDD